MKLQGLLAQLIVSASFIFSASPVQAEDSPNTRPHSLFTRMSGYDVRGTELKKFEARELIVGFNTETSEKAKKIVEGKYEQVTYLRQSGLEPNSSIYVARNHEEAIKKLGGEVLYGNHPGSYYEYITFKIEKDGKIIWGEIDLTAGGDDFRITTITEGDMEQEVTAQMVEAKVKDEGRYVVYGINFDTNKATIREDSVQAISLIAEMLKNSDLKVYIVGHTDNVGTFVNNQQLSEKRAQSVVNELVSKYKIPANRMIAKGVGQLAPVASNSSEDGRQKNRRVEVVAF